MNIYYELLGISVFSPGDVAKYYNNINSARSAIKSLVSSKLAVKIRNNLYTCISGETGAPVANRYQIACSITDTAYLSHHTAIEYYGLSDQMYYDVYVSSQSSFREFTFDGYTFKYISERIRTGVDSVDYSGGVRVTDMERTLLDSINDMDLISGMEEVIVFIQAIRRVDENKVREYLLEYDKNFLYQKTGYLLEKYYKGVELSDSFYDWCKTNSGKSKRYLSRDYPKGKYNSKWKLIVPDSELILKNGEIFSND